MKTRRKLLPGQPGTQKLLEQYGDALVCVRYRYDAEENRRIKTVELIVDSGPWRKQVSRVPSNKLVYVRIGYAEGHLQKLVRASGGKWDRGKQAWKIAFGEVKQLGLTGRIVDFGSDISNNRK